jgi:hypothetical protein
MLASASRANSYRGAYVPIRFHTYSLVAKRRWHHEHIDLPFVSQDVRSNSTCP